MDRSVYSCLYIKYVALYREDVLTLKWLQYSETDSLCCMGEPVGGPYSCCREIKDWSMEERHSVLSDKLHKRGTQKNRADQTSGSPRHAPPESQLQMFCKIFFLFFGLFFWKQIYFRDRDKLNSSRLEKPSFSPPYYNYIQFINRLHFLFNWLYLNTFVLEKQFKLLGISFITIQLQR